MGSIGSIKVASRNTKWHLDVSRWGRVYFFMKRNAARLQRSLEHIPATFANVLRLERTHPVLLRTFRSLIYYLMCLIRTTMAKSVKTSSAALHRRSSRE